MSSTRTEPAHTLNFYMLAITLLFSLCRTFFSHRFLGLFLGIFLLVHTFAHRLLPFCYDTIRFNLRETCSGSSVLSNHRAQYALLNAEKVNKFTPS